MNDLNTVNTVNLNKDQAQLLGAIQSLDKRSCLMLMGLLLDRVLQLEMNSPKKPVIAL